MAVCTNKPFVFFIILTTLTGRTNSAGGIFSSIADHLVERPGLSTNRVFIDKYRMIKMKTK